MKTNVVYKKIVLIRLCELLVGCRADGVICMLYETLGHYGFKDVIREGLGSGRFLAYIPPSSRQYRYTKMSDILPWEHKWPSIIFELATSQKVSSVTCRRSVVSSGYSGFLHQITDFIIIISPP